MTDQKTIERKILKINEKVMRLSIKVNKQKSKILKEEWKVQRAIVNNKPKKMKNHTRNREQAEMKMRVLQDKIAKHNDKLNIIKNRKGKDDGQQTKQN